VTAKQERVEVGLVKLKRRAGESQGSYFRRVASFAGCSVGCVQYWATLAKWDRIGAEVRAREAAAAGVAVAATTCGLDFLSVREFRGWANVFARFKVLTEAYLEVSRTRGDVFATAFLLDIRERCDRAQERAVM
jgi:hypothetical protein